MRDPIGTMRKVYERFDEPFTPPVEAAMQKMMAANPKGRFGKHEYALEEFGLTADGVRRHFKDYRSEEHTSELQSLMRLSYAVFCLEKKNTHHHIIQI